MLYSENKQGRKKRYAPYKMEYLVDVAGYIPKEQQLQQLLDSGRSLDIHNRNRFPGLTNAFNALLGAVGGKSASYQPDGSDAIFDPTAQKGYDYFDYFDDVSVLRSKVSQTLEDEYKRREALKASEMAAFTAAAGQTTPTTEASRSTPPVSKEANDYVP